jgi:uncharacterized membrane protein YeaQ/YmgE (transglycosylase-associated protein family)
MTTHIRALRVLAEVVICIVGMLAGMMIFALLSVTIATPHWLGFPVAMICALGLVWLTDWKSETRP